MQEMEHHVTMMIDKKGKLSGRVILQHEVEVAPFDFDESLTSKERAQLLIDMALLRRAEEIEIEIQDR